MPLSTMIFLSCAGVSIYVYGCYAMAHKPGVFFQPDPRIDYTSIVAIEMKPTFGLGHYFISSVITTLYAMPMYLILLFSIPLFFISDNHITLPNLIIILLSIATTAFFLCMLHNRMQEVAEIKNNTL